MLCSGAGAASLRDDAEFLLGLQERHVDLVDPGLLDRRLEYGGDLELARPGLGPAKGQDRGDGDEGKGAEPSAQNCMHGFDYLPL